MLSSWYDFSQHFRYTFLSECSSTTALSPHCSQRDGGFHYLCCGRQTFNFAQNFLRAYCPPCAKPHSCTFGHLSRVLSVTLHYRFVLHCRYGTQFHYFIGLHSIVGMVLNSTTLSVYTPLSVWYSIPLLCRFALHCRYDTQFNYFVGLHSIVGMVLNSVCYYLNICLFLSMYSKNAFGLSPR